VGAELWLGCCDKCGFADLSLAKDPCPECGSKLTMNYFSGSMLNVTEFRSRLTRSEQQGPFRDVTHRRKLSGEGKLARETQTVDRSKWTETIKTHVVREFIDGQWVTVHEHEQTFPAKRRLRIGQSKGGNRAARYLFSSESTQGGESWILTWVPLGEGTAISKEVSWETRRNLKSAGRLHPDPIVTPEEIEAMTAE
jgi:hypothetical protein